MPFYEQRLAQEAFHAEIYYVALAITSAFTSLVSVDKPTPRDLAEIHTAETAWKKASKALADYQARMRKR